MNATKDFASVTRFLPGTPFVEAFGLLTASLLLSDGKNGDGGIRAVCVTAAHEGAGASTTALNLALTVAGSGRRTLLIDANMRAAALHVPFNVPVSPGLAEILMKKAALKDAVRATKISNLYLLPAGTSSSSPHALLQPAILSTLFEQVRGSYDFAIVDTAPALRFPDAMHIARLTNGAVLVLPAEGAPRRAELEVRRRLERVDANILGIVLNRKP
jgi:capsular exopolysaccharide synthesis family protein